MRPRKGGRRGRASIKRASALVSIATLLTVPGAGAEVRPAGLDQGWYPSSRAAATAVAHYLARQARDAPSLPGRPVGLVLPHAGWAFSGLAAAAALRGLRAGDFERVVMLAPLHAGGFSGYAIEDVSAYRTPLGEVALCPQVAALRDKAAGRPAAQATAREHAIEVLLPLLQATLGRFCLVPVLLGQTQVDDERALAKSLRGLHDGRTLFVASSDFVHYGERFGFTPFGPTLEEAGERLSALDGRAVDLVSAKDAPALRAFFDETGHNACGGRAVLVLLELLSIVAPGAHATLVARYASSDLPLGDRGSVGYAALAFTAQASPGSPAPPLRPPSPLPAVAADDWRLSETLGQRLARLARGALETELGGGSSLASALSALGDVPELRRRQGVFVSLYREGPRGTPTQERLRGCRGQGQPQLPLDLAVVQAALEAGLHDDRFPRVRGEELARLQIEVSVLSPLREIDAPADYARGRDGLVLTKGSRGALFLPQVWREAGWSTEDALRELSAKAELPREAWRDAHLLAFEAQSFEDGHPGPSPP